MSACSQDWRVGARWRWIIPLGSLVVPELNRIRPGSPGVDPRGAGIEHRPAGRTRVQERGVQDASPTATLQRRNGRRSESTRAAISSPRRRPSRVDWVRTPATDDRSSRSTSSAGVENVDRGTATPPASATPKMAATASGRLPITIPTRVPSPTPRATRPPAMARDSAFELGVGPAIVSPAAQRVVEHERFAVGVTGADLEQEPAQGQGSDALDLVERRTGEGRHAGTPDAPDRDGTGRRSRCARWRRPAARRWSRRRTAGAGRVAGGGRSPRCRTRRTCRRRRGAAGWCAARPGPRRRRRVGRPARRPAPARARRGRATGRTGPARRHPSHGTWASASWNCTAWNFDSGLSNCTRSTTCAVASSTARRSAPATTKPVRVRCSGDLRRRGRHRHVVDRDVADEGPKRVPRRPPRWGRRRASPSMVATRQSSNRSAWSTRVLDASAPGGWWPSRRARSEGVAKTAGTTGYGSTTEPAARHSAAAASAESGSAAASSAPTPSWSSSGRHLGSDRRIDLGPPGHVDVAGVGEGLRRHRAELERVVAEVRVHRPVLIWRHRSGRGTR